MSSGRVGGVCEMCMCMARGGVDGEWIRRLGLAFTNPVGNEGQCWICVCVWVAVVWVCMWGVGSWIMVWKGGGWCESRLCV